MADEPTGSLDPDTSREIMQLLSKINKRNTTVIVSTHNKGIVDDLRNGYGFNNGKVIKDEQLGPIMRSIFFLLMKLLLR